MGICMKNSMGNGRTIETSIIAHYTHFVQHKHPCVEKKKQNNDPLIVVCTWMPIRLAETPAFSPLSSSTQCDICSRSFLSTLSLSCPFQEDILYHTVFLANSKCVQLYSLWGYIWGNNMKALELSRLITLVPLHRAWTYSSLILFLSVSFSL